MATARRMGTRDHPKCPGAPAAYLPDHLIGE